MTDPDSKLDSDSVAPATPYSEEAVEQELRRQARLLAERVKELNCMYSVSKLANQRDMRLEDILQGTAEIVPSAWQYPEVACAQISLACDRYHTSGFVETTWKQAAPIIAAGAPVGSIEVCYLEQKPEADEGPFLLEERHLINALAQQLGEIIERKFADRQLLWYQEQLRSLAEELVRAEERERRRLACSLHDRIGQTLAAVRIRLTMLLDSQEWPDPTARRLRDLGSLVAQTIDDTRTLIFDLSPPILYEVGLAAALEWLADVTRDQFGIEVEAEEQGGAQEIRIETQVMLFTAARELVTNATKHAQASRIRISLQWLRDEVRLDVEDDGVGFDVTWARQQGVRTGAFGLFSVQERLTLLGGRLRIESKPGRGTRANVSLRLDEKAKA